MSTHDPDPHHHSRYEHRQHARDQDRNQRHQAQPEQHLRIGVRLAQDHEGLIRRPLSVEEDPRGGETDQGEESEGVGEERVGEHDGEYDQVVDAEVGGILAHARGGVGEGDRSRERGAVDELDPGAAVRERVAGEAGEAREDGPERRERK